MNNKELNNLIEHILSELKKSKLYTENIINEKKDEDYEKYYNILTSINEKIHFYENFNMLDKNEMDNIENENSGSQYNDICQEYEEGYSKELNFFNDYKKNKKLFDINSLKKKVILGYTIEGNAIIINNENFLKFFKNFDKNSSIKYHNKEIVHNSRNTKEKRKINDKENNESKENEEYEDYFSEKSCSSSSVISLKTFIENNKNLRINKNRETYIKHKYDDNSYINHKIDCCSDCSSSSFSWYDKKYDNLFYYSNLLKEDKHLKKNNSIFTDTIKKKKKNISPFYNYIYFKYLEKNKKKLYPVFVNNKNGKKKIWNLKKTNKYYQNYQSQTNKYELDNSFFSYKNYKYLCSTENETNKKNINFKKIENISLKNHNFEKDEINYSIDKIIHQLEKISNSENNPNRKVTFNDHFSNFIKKNKDYLKKENNFAFKELCDTDKIKLKVKIIGTNGKIIKNKCLDNVIINKSKTFGDLAYKLGHFFKLPKDKIENIKIFFDGDLCNKDMTFNNNELGLEDGYQIDVKFPLTDDTPCIADESSFSDDSYIIFLPDSYVIE
ncbi:conserved Plasmodium protein, unknown function [Plasmodium gallinaceum]|uniref:Uncharacterized protein n=1 Tax=Plasmodium gallinaceum TaxID=5849 RepID=A0A1J1H2J9_PLAGA|nr:conserved Plasmodium protein, unknown function [Plasmodium gallinaceum]CRG97566.1 conserved Plasmodium protein, unknown function [Plasmodium gallinaceum]